MSATIVGRWQKVLKLHWLKRPKAVPKIQKAENKWFKTSHLELSFDFRFSSRKYQSQQKLAKNTVLLKKPRSFYEPQHTQHF